MDAPSVIVGSGRVEKGAPGRAIVGFLVDGGDGPRDLTFDIPDWAAPSRLNSDAAALAGLLPAMSTGRKLVVNGPVSARLLTNMRELGAVMSMWFPEFVEVEIEAAAIDDSADDHFDRPSALFFSGGVDSFHALLEYPQELTYLVHVDALDTISDVPELHQQISVMLDDVADRTQVGLIRVGTNLRSFLDPAADWTLHAHALALGVVGHALAGGIGTVVLAADRTYAELKPYAIHPVTAPLYGSHLLAAQSYGWAATRVDKVAAIAEWDVAMDHLRVCWQNPNGAYNCSVCEKCVRTIIELELVGGLDRCQTLGSLPDLETIAALELRSPFLIDHAIPATAKALSDPSQADLAAVLGPRLDRALAHLASRRMAEDWRVAIKADGGVEEFTRTHRDDLYRALSAYEGRWLVKTVLRDLPMRVLRKLRSLVSRSTD